MNKVQFNKLGMAKAVLAEMAKNETIWKDSGSMVRALNDLRAKIDAVGDLVKLQEARNHSLFERKTQKKNALADLASEVTSALLVFAKDNPNLALQGEIRYSLSDFRAFSDQECLLHCSTVLREAESISERLIPEYLNQETLTAFSKELGEFNETATLPVNVKSEAKSSTSRLVVLFSEISGILNERVDRLMTAYRRKYPDFYGSYRNSRRVRSAAGTKVPVPPPTSN